MSSFCDCGGHGASTQPLRESSYDMMQVEDAVRVVLEHTTPVEAEDVDAADALHRVLAAPVESTEPLPPFRASIMDGYAVVAADGVGEFPVVNRIAAGDAPTGAISAGQVAYITTGSPVPEGADAVVKIEDTDGVFDATGGASREIAVKVLKAVAPGQNIRAIGSDIQPGEQLLAAHERVTPAALGLLATAGVARVPAFRRPIVGVLSTGSELVEPFAPTAPGKIRDSNRPTLLALIASWQLAATRDLGVCSDHSTELERSLRRALESVDVLVTSGGVSMGDHDLVKPLLERLGTVHFGRLWMKPGKPTTFATVEIAGRRRLVFGLPGNPVSAFTTCHLLVRPAVRKLAGLPVSAWRASQVLATLTHDIRLDAERPEFHRASVAYDVQTQRFLATSTGRQISSRLLSCRGANALLSLPTGSVLHAGERVLALLLDDAFGQVSALPLRSSTPTAAVPAPTPVASTPAAAKKPFRAGILTISDRVSRGDATDLSGPAMADMLAQSQLQVVERAVVPDEISEIRRVVTDWTDHDKVDLLLTSGGTGFSPRDVTPEAIKAILHKEIPGFVIAMLESSRKITPKAVLSRPVAGIRGRAIILTLPGKPKAVVENFSALQDVLPHALHLVRDEPHEHHRPAVHPSA
ncbi:hypothetical protein P43SY_002956 [Pythium insidiosum]|uniref:MoaB/Mog domain-containing protein n=1 Tax=Pythium insidiosum TaxID=114742 RepID=A0AAD5LEK3_PYTIN|nr:hypothetical protein P43SY_002956 [Pythium insidiosum]